MYTTETKSRPLGGSSADNVDHSYGSLENLVSHHVHDYLEAGITPHSDSKSLQDWLDLAIPGSEDAQDAWLRTPHPVLLGKTPAEVVISGHLDNVVAILIRLIDERADAQIG